ncbi:MAG TPA: TRAFs-binding domain-containing protein [Pyrinomonadaceae bacterium]|nr:TRAFs-binding domain-containing protein [Pyrinomonadaceae bacterium]
MPEETETQGTCFVVMGFGKKTDFETGRTLDLDMSYQNMIKPAVEAAGLKCIRADEIVHSGMIDLPMYEQLLKADVVVADISTSNKNALYELGVRHALRPYTTLVIAEDGIKVFPFDLNHVVVRQYHHLGEDIGVKEAKRFSGMLTDAIIQIAKKDPRDSDSPVYTLLSKLDPPALGRALDDAIGSAAAAVAVAGVAPAAGAPPDLQAVHSLLMQQVDAAQSAKDFDKARTILASVREMMKPKPVITAGEPVIERAEDPYIIQRLALLTYKSKKPTEAAALEEARELLKVLNPATSNDTETLGLWGAVHKRLWDSTKDAAKDTDYLNEAVRSYERGFYLRNDYYNGINLAYLLNVRCANTPTPAEAIADFVQAQRIRREVLEVCRDFLNTERPTVDVQYWVKATQAEAYIGIGDNVQGQLTLTEAMSLPVAQWMKDSTQEQLDKLTPLLADSPLKHLKEQSSPAS